MKLRSATALLVALTLVVSMAPVLAQDVDEVIELRMLWYVDGNDDEVMRDLLDRFESENPGTRVVLDAVPRSNIRQVLSTQLDAGMPPDMARVPDSAGAAPRYLDMTPYLRDPAYWEENFGSFLQWMHPQDDMEGIYGYIPQLTLTGPFINRSLFEEAGVQVPSDTSDEVSWEEWAEAARAVAQATGVAYPMAMDYSGFHFAGPALSMGAQYFEGGYQFVDDQGFRAMAELFVRWHEDGTMPFEIWAGFSGNDRAAGELFIDGELAFYMSDSSQIRWFDDQIGDSFVWEAVPNPCGPAACTGMPRGGAVVALQDTAYPEQVTFVMEYLASPEALAAFSARSLSIPAHMGLATGATFEADLELTRDALDVFARQVDRLSSKAVALQGRPDSQLIFDATRDRLTQAIVGELPLDEAIQGIQEDVGQALK